MIYIGTKTVLVRDHSEALLEYNPESVPLEQLQFSSVMFKVNFTLCTANGQGDVGRVNISAVNVASNKKNKYYLYSNSI